MPVFANLIGKPEAFQKVRSRIGNDRASVAIQVGSAWRIDGKGVFFRSRF